MISDIIEQVLQGDTNPFELQEIIKKITKVPYSMYQIRKIMRKCGMSFRKRTLNHVNHASVSAVRGWRYRVEKRISRLKKLGFKIFGADEAYFVQGRDASSTWGPVGKRSGGVYLGNHFRISIIGAIGENGEQKFKSYRGRLTAKEFIEFLEELYHEHDKIALICDNWSVHKSKEVKEYLKANKNVRIIKLPKGSLYLNVTEQCWNIGKRSLLGSVIYGSLDEMQDTITEFFDKTSFAHLDLYKYLYRNPRKALNHI